MAYHLLDKTKPFGNTTLSSIGAFETIKVVCDNCAKEGNQFHKDEHGEWPNDNWAWVRFWGDNCDECGARC